MIRVTRLDGTITFLNPDLIVWVDSGPETLISFADGKKLMVKDSAENVREQFENFKKRIWAASENLSHG